MPSASPRNGVTVAAGLFVTCMMLVSMIAGPQHAMLGSSCVAAALLAAMELLRFNHPQVALRAAPQLEARI